MIERAMAVAATIVVPVALRALPFRTTLAICDAWPATRGTSVSAAALARAEADAAGRTVYVGGSIGPTGEIRGRILLYPRNPRPPAFTWVRDKHDKDEDEDNDRDHSS